MKYHPPHFCGLKRAKQEWPPSHTHPQVPFADFPVECFMLSDVGVWMRWRLPSAATTTKCLVFSLSKITFPIISVYNLTCLVAARLDVAVRNELYTHMKHQRVSITNWSWDHTSLTADVLKNKGSKIFRYKCVQGPLKLNVLCWNQFMLSIAKNSQSLDCDLLFGMAILKKKKNGIT